MTIPRIVLDTCVLHSALIEQQQEHFEYFAELYAEHQLGLIELVITKAIQAEFYGILRAGRTTVWSHAEQRRVALVLTHGRIMNFLELYIEIFDKEYLDSIQDLDWSPGRDSEGLPLYKRTFREEIRNQYGWRDLGHDYIQRMTLSDPRENGAKDKWDYPGIASALHIHAHLIVTDNRRDFPIKLQSRDREILILETRDARDFNHFLELEGLS